MANLHQRLEIDAFALYEAHDDLWDALWATPALPDHITQRLDRYLAGVTASVEGLTLRRVDNKLVAEPDGELLSLLALVRGCARRG